MNKLKIAFLTDMDIMGSGYKNLSTSLCDGLAAKGHEIKVIGLNYGGQEHFHDFTIIPITDMRSAMVAAHNLFYAWKFDVLIVAMDIPVHNLIISQLQHIRNNFRYIGIMPIEADPLCQSWAMILLQMDLPLIISEFGTHEAHEAGVSTASIIPIGIDVNVWKPSTADEREVLRKRILGVQNDAFVVLTVADNQERKNLSAAMEGFRDFSVQYPNSKYVLVTRINNPVGWSLHDLANEYGIADKFLAFERGLPQEQLWSLYASSDVFLLPSKAEGLGLPLLEAMAVGIPCIATDCTGMRELLSDGRGILIPPILTHRDAFGNGRRYWINIGKITDALVQIKTGALPDVKAAQEFVTARTWDKSINLMENYLSNMFEEKHEEEKITTEE